MSVAFIACIEAGRLEQEGTLLFRSIRRFAGRYAGARLLSFQPRRGPPLAPATRAVLDELEVRHVEERLNAAHEDQPFLNKVAASAWAEEHLSEDVIVFCDSDTLFTGEPGELDLHPPWAAAARPVNRKNRGSTGPGDPRDPYWQGLYRLCGVEPGRFCTTTVDRVRIREYWNAGLIAVRRSAGLFSAWLRNVHALLEAGHVPADGINNLDQFALAATLTRCGDRLQVLDGRYNYPLPMRGLLEEPLRSAQLEELRHLHYFRWFHKPGFLDALAPPLAPDSEVVRWLKPYLPHLPIDESPGRGQNRGLFA